MRGWPRKKAIIAGFAVLALGLILGLLTLGAGGACYRLTGWPALQPLVEKILPCPSRLANDLDVDLKELRNAYRAPGAGAVKRSLSSKLGDSLSARDFGAVGDGVTDDTAAIQMAIEAAYASGSKYVFLPPTSAGYRISRTLTFPGNGVTLYGFQTRLVWGGGASPMIVIDTGLYWIMLRDLILDGGGAAARGIHIAPSAGRSTGFIELDNVRIMNLAASGIGVDFGNGAGGGQGGTDGIRLKWVKIDGAAVCVRINNVFAGNIYIETLDCTHHSIAGFQVLTGSGPFTLVSPWFGQGRNTDVPDIKWDSTDAGDLQIIGMFGSEHGRSLEVTAGLPLITLIGGHLNANSQGPHAVKWTANRGILTFIGVAVVEGSIYMAPPQSSGQVSFVDLGSYYSAGPPALAGISGKVRVFSLANKLGLGYPSGAHGMTLSMGLGDPSLGRAGNAGFMSRDAAASAVAAVKVEGISATGTNSLNLRGQVTFAGDGTAAVTFGNNEPDASYFISLAGGANETFWVTDKALTGFTIRSSNAASTATVDWHLLR